jgi:hypothetical protein
LEKPRSPLQNEPTHPRNFVEKMPSYEGGKSIPTAQSSQGVTAVEGDKVKVPDMVIEGARLEGLRLEGDKLVIRDKNTTVPQILPTNTPTPTISLPAVS